VEEQVGAENGFALREWDNLTPHLVAHYRRVLEETTAGAEALDGRVSGEYIENMKRGLQRWVDGGEAGWLAWGIFRFERV